MANPSQPERREIYEHHTKPEPPPSNRPHGCHSRGAHRRPSGEHHCFCPRRVPSPLPNPLRGMLWRGNRRIPRDAVVRPIRLGLGRDRLQRRDRRLLSRIRLPRERLPSGYPLHLSGHRGYVGQRRHGSRADRSDGGFLRRRWRARHPITAVSASEAWRVHAPPGYVFVARVGANEARSPRCGPRDGGISHATTQDCALPDPSSEIPAHSATSASSHRPSSRSTCTRRPSPGATTAQWRSRPPLRTPR